MDPIFSDCQEIRMGPPYSCCRLSFDCDVSFDLPDYDWQNQWCTSDDGRYIALIAWDTPDKQPGFRVVVIDTVANSIIEHDREHGCCESISWLNGQFEWTAFPDGKGAVSPVHKA